MKFEITKEQAEAILKYLCSRPYLEVHEGVKMLQSLPLIQEAKTELKAVEAKVESVVAAAKADLKSV